MEYAKAHLAKTDEKSIVQGDWGLWPVTKVWRVDRRLNNRYGLYMVNSYEELKIKVYMFFFCFAEMRWGKSFQHPKFIKEDEN